LGFGYNHNM
jgi:hypothetical protein